jgi:hypothetical protein
MPECDYCGASFDDEAAELKHLRSEHADELGPIDRRRVGDVDGDDEGLPTGPIALGVVLLASAAIVGYVVFAAGSGGASVQPQNDGTHEHGTIEATIDGQEIDFTRSEFARNDQYFHIHRGSADPLWHAHGSPITVEYALGTFGIELNDDGTELTFQNETYSESDGAEIRIEVNGESVDPNYTIEGVGPEDAARNGEGDDIRVVVETQ